MYYKEFLRVRAMFMWFAIVIAAIALFATLVNGHAHMTVDMAAAAPAPHVTSGGFGPATHEATNVQGPGIVVNDTDLPEWSIVLAIAGFVTAIFGSVLGTVLACENSGHLEIAWTRPASRVQYAARLIGVDVVAILAMFAFTVAACALVIYSHGWQHLMVARPDTRIELARFIACPLGWYGFVAALTASVRGRAGVIAGFSWIGASVLVALADAPLPRLMHDLIVAVNYANPMLYGSYSSGAEAARHGAMVSPPLALAGLVSIAAVGIVAALAQWRRLEA